MSVWVRRRFELLAQLGLSRLVLDPDSGEPVGLLGRPVLERELAGLLEEDVDDDALGGSKQHLFDELLTLVVTAVGADELHPCARQGDVEDAGVGRVREVEANDLATLGLQREIRLSSYEHRVAEASHRHVRRFGLAERGDASLLYENIVERQ